MAISVFDLFKIGIGPSSSHTVGPMRAAKKFVDSLHEKQLLSQVDSLKVVLYGSLGATGKGHGSDKAILLGLEGEVPETVDPSNIDQRLLTIRTQKRLTLPSHHSITFDENDHLILHKNKSLPYHSNGMKLTAKDESGMKLYSNIYYSIGGGFVVEQGDAEKDKLHASDDTKVPFPFNSMHELLQLCKENNLSISQLMMENEKSWRTESEIRHQLLAIWQVMQSCIKNGCENEGILPGGLNVKRRAPVMYKKLKNQFEQALTDPLTTMDWVNMYAIAVNEENAAGGRVVTAPTNGAAGIIPAVLKYYDRFSSKSDEQGIVRFLLTAAAIGILYKENASISGAEVGCQGEVGSACSMAAAGLTEVSGGTPEQVENAAEIAMEHNLGLTCDPVNGLVQVPCIERNAMAAIKAINAKRMSMSGDGEHFVSLDKVIKTMRDTGRDMKKKYKVTALGGLAVNVIEC